MGKNWLPRELEGQSRRRLFKIILFVFLIIGDGDGIRQKLIIRKIKGCPKNWVP